MTAQTFDQYFGLPPGSFAKYLRDLEENQIRLERERADRIALAIARRKRNTGSIHEYQHTLPI